MAYVGAASDDDMEFFNHISGYLREMGAGAVTLARSSKGARVVHDAEDIGSGRCYLHKRR